MSTLRLHWMKASYKSYYAKVGPLTISIRRTRTTPFKWFVWEVFGSRVHDNGKEYGGLWQAMNAAERHAERTLRVSRAAFSAHPAFGGTIDGS